MASGKPIIASRLGAIPSVIDEEQTGILIRPGEVSELVEAIEDLLDSPARAAKLSSQGIRQAELLYDKERMIDKTLETFRKVVSVN
jgi:glycosyltransferase involved in cell wall biosynthesis